MSEQNYIPCAVAQDLMPLITDGAASEQSSRLVQQHMAACPACTQVYQAMQSAAPAPVAQAQAEQGFRQAIKRQRKRMRAWKTAALCLGIVLVLCFTIVCVHPQMLLGIWQDVPAAWVQDASVVRTAQGALLIQFTPAQRYQRFYGYAHISRREGILSFSWRYPWIEKVLGQSLDESAYAANQAVLCMDDGRWLDLSTLRAYRYQDGAFFQMVNGPLSNENIQALLAQNQQVSDYSGVYQAEACSIQKICLTSSSACQSMHPDRNALVLYDAAIAEIPLCDAQTQAAFDAYIAANPSYYPADGELIPYSPYYKGKE